MWSDVCESEPCWIWSGVCAVREKCDVSVCLSGTKTICVRLTLHDTSRSTLTSRRGGYSLTGTPSEWFDKHGCKIKNGFRFAPIGPLLAHFWPQHCLHTTTLFSASERSRLTHLTGFIFQLLQITCNVAYFLKW